jgi:hypothetical protein
MAIDDFWSKGVQELIDHLSTQDIKVVNYDEEENSIKNFLFSMFGKRPRGHIGPSSWLDPSGELTIYASKRARRTPEAFRRFLIEEIKHVDQLREAPFSTKALAGYEEVKEGVSQIPYWLLSALPDFISEEDSRKYYANLMKGIRESIDEDFVFEEPLGWKEKSGIGALLSNIRYSRYADPESVEGIHRNRERYAPILEKVLGAPWMEEHEYRRKAERDEHSLPPPPDPFEGPTEMPEDYREGGRTRLI